MKRICQIVGAIVIAGNLYAQYSSIPGYWDSYRLVDLSSANPASVYWIDLSSSCLDSVPEIVFTFYRVDRLNLGFNDITILPENLSKLTNLSILYLHGNKHLRVDQIIHIASTLPKLGMITLNDCDILRLPESISMLSTVEVLSIGSNPLVTLPESICLLANLGSLELWDAKNLRCLPNRMDKMDSLRCFNLSNNVCLDTSQDLWLSILSMKQLEELRLIGNGLTKIPDKFAGFVKLEILDLSCNFLRTIPPSLATLPKLRKLILLKNPIEQDELRRIKKMLPNVEVIWF